MPRFERPLPSSVSSASTLSADEVVREHGQRGDLESRVGQVRGEHRVELQALYTNTAPPPCEQLAFQVVTALCNRVVHQDRFQGGNGRRIGVALESRVPHRHVERDVLAPRSERNTDEVTGSRAAVDDRPHGHRTGVANAFHRIVGLSCSR